MYEIVTKTKIIKEMTDAIFGETVTEVSIDDDAGGCYITITQEIEEKQTVRVTTEEWPTIKKVVDEMCDICKELNSRG